MAARQALLALAALVLAAAVRPVPSAPSPPYPGVPKPPPPVCPPGARRVSCASARFTEAPAATPSSDIIDGPVLGNGNIGAAMSAADGGLQLWLGANNMWSTNTAPDHGLCDSAAARASPTHSGAVYTLISAGRVALTPAKPLSGNAAAPDFSALLDLERGSLEANLTYVATASEPVQLRTESIVAANNDTLVVKLSTSVPLALVVEVAVPQSATRVSAGAPWVLPTEAGVGLPHGLPMYAAREGVNQVDNNLLLNSCGRGGQHDGAQRFVVDPDGAVTTRDGRCLQLAGRPLGPDCTNSTLRLTVGPCGGAGTAWRLSAGQLILAAQADSPQYYAVVAGPRPPSVPGYGAVPGSVGGQSRGGLPLCRCTSVADCPAQAAAQCNASSTCQSFAVYLSGGSPGWDGWCQMYDTADTKDAYPDGGWNLWRKLPSRQQSVFEWRQAPRHGVKQPTGAPYDRLGDPWSQIQFVVADTSPSTEVWSHDSSSGVLFITENAAATGEACLTFAEPNRNINVAVAVTVVDASGTVVDVAGHVASNGAFASNTTISLQPDRPLWLLATVYVCCKGCEAIGTRRCPTLPPTAGNAAVQPAVAAAMDQQHAVARLQDDTMRFWDGFWNASSINLGPQYRQLEQFYYGMQYTVGAASRPGKMAPGLWGPWITTDGAGWNGDYTLNYNVGIHALRCHPFRTTHR